MNSIQFSELDWIELKLFELDRIGSIWIDVFGGNINEFWSWVLAGNQVVFLIVLLKKPE